ncbi:hypothetical protein [Chondromyces crocatus]|uniref:hypothetical protein n=1 Tax=Chondromyces crocatus TaxID=52 RepID=UPI00067E57B6|nr:hypothetical protein [Chondromyces crocatus]
MTLGVYHVAPSIEQRTAGLQHGSPHEMRLSFQAARAFRSNPSRVRAGDRPFDGQEPHAAAGSS